MEYDKGKDATIELLGISGLVCCAACALQQLIMSAHYLTSLSAVVINGVAIIAFGMFMKMKKISVILLWIATILMFLQQCVFIATGAILWLSFLVMIYCIITIAVIYIQDLQSYIAEVEKDQAEPLW
jgi:signal transduction histidine kinase